MKRKNGVFYLLLCTILLVSSRMPEPGKGNAIIQPDKTSPVQTLAAEIYRQFIATHKIISSGQNPEVAVVDSISNRIINAVKGYYQSKKSAKELDGFNWETHFIQEAKEDAWCLPGGKIAVYSSLLPVTQSDASLAVILSHSIAHILLKHGDIRMKQYLKEYLGKKDLSAALSAKPAETKDFFKMAYGNGDYVGVIRGFSSADEMEADQLGAIFCGLAGYNPTEAIVFWERMNKFNGSGRQPQLLSSHPLDDKRIPHLKEIMDDIVMNYYRPISKK